MSEKMKHTTLSIHKSEGELYIAEPLYLMDSANGIVAIMYDWDKEKAEHIVNCVSSHDALVEALKACISSLEVQKRRIINGELLILPPEDRAQSAVNFTVSIIQAEIDKARRTLREVGEGLS